MFLYLFYCDVTIQNFITKSLNFQTLKLKINKLI